MLPGATEVKTVQLQLRMQLLYLVIFIVILKANNLIFVGKLTDKE